MPTAHDVSAGVAKAGKAQLALLSEIDEGYFGSGEDVLEALLRYIEERRCEITFA